MNNINCTNKPEYRQLYSNKLTISGVYQRVLDTNRVKKIVAAFNPNLVNPIKVSHRDNKYFVFNGQHTLAALKLKNGNSDLLVDCRIYEGLSEADEAKLFAEQNGVSRPPKSNVRFKALYVAGDIDVFEMIELTNKSGLYIDFSKSKVPNRVTSISKAYKIFKSVSASDYVEILTILKQIWGGSIESLTTEILGGIYLFHIKYKGKYDRGLLIKQLSRVSPIVIKREGKAYSGGGDLRFAIQMLNIYNKNLSKNRLKEIQ